jgi:hypothetical protein
MIGTPKVTESRASNRNNPHSMSMGFELEKHNICTLETIFTAVRITGYFKLPIIMKIGASLAEGGV